MSPKLNIKRGRFVLSRLDQILEWEQKSDEARDKHFVELGKYLCEIRAGQFWRLENLKSFDDFLQTRFRDSRRKAYYLMSIHEQLPKRVKSQLKEIGWSKAAELVKIARRNSEGFDCATWLHKAKESTKEEFKEEVEKFLTGSSEPTDLMCQNCGSRTNLEVHF